MKHSTKTIAIAAALAAALPAAALAGPGDPVREFGEDGEVRTSFAPEAPYAGAKAISRLGNGYVTAGNAFHPMTGRSIAIARYTADGALDESFSGDGRLLIPASVDVVGVSGVHGNIVVGGSADDGSALVALAVRGDGTADTDFSGDGIASLDVGGPVEAFSFDHATPNNYTFGAKLGTGADSDLLMARLEPNGEPAARFSGDGIARIDFGGRERGGWVAARAGNPWIVGESGNDIAIARLKRNGTLARGFSDDGKRLVAAGAHRLPRAIAEDRSGGAVIALEGFRGSASSPKGDHAAVLKMKGGGSIDRSYGRKGIAVLERFGSEEIRSAEALRAIKVNRRNKAVVAGSTFDTADDEGSDFALARFTRNGRLDRSFGRRGRVVTDFGASDGAEALLADRRDIIVAGDTCRCDPVDPDTSTGEVALAAYRD